MGERDFSCFRRGLIKCHPTDQTRLPPVFVNKVLLEETMLICLHVALGSLHDITAEVCSFQRPHGPHCLKYLTLVLSKCLQISVSVRSWWQYGECGKKNNLECGGGTLNQGKKKEKQGERNNKMESTDLFGWLNVWGKKGVNSFIFSNWGLRCLSLTKMRIMKGEKIFMGK